jgi:MYXO-CTERM domain-containing protein
MLSTVTSSADSGVGTLRAVERDCGREHDRLRDRRPDHARDRAADDHGAGDDRRAGSVATDANGCAGFATPALIVDAMAAADAGVAADATDNEIGSSSGCGCRSSNPSTLLVLLAIGLIRPRLRRRES